MSMTLAALTVIVSVAAGQTPGEAVASIRLYNPTDYSGLSLVEIPVGPIASPGIIDWDQHRLMHAGEEVPFSIREGRAHWKAALTAPINAPRAEDLLVFWCDAPPGEWVEVQIVPGAPDRTSMMVREGETITVRYPDVEAVVDAQSGMLAALNFFGESAIDGPMTLDAWPLPPDPFQYAGSIGPGYTPFRVDVKHADSTPVTVQLASTSSTPALTELNFLVETGGGPELAVTYRIHRGGLAEIWIDERPWSGESPWMTYAVACALPLRGQRSPLPLLENRQPFYGFKDFAGTIAQVAQWYAGSAIDVVELGEEIPNGRRWVRRLQAVPHGDDAALDSLVEIMDEGLIVRPVPIHARDSAAPLEILSDERTAPMAHVLLAALSETGIPAGVTTDESKEGLIRFELLNQKTETGITGDGFEIRQDTAGTVRVCAKTLLGLHQAAVTMAAGVRQNGRLPLVARNPVVDVRGGGFGGGNFEVDFPYADDAEWERVFENLLESGMNTFWCLGMWSNWKLPVGYASMPELRSDSPTAYDESSGVLFSELDQHREHGLKLMHFLQSRGGRVHVWLPIGCVPTTFMEHYPEAMKPGAVEEFWGRPKGTPCFTHPTYRKYLDAFLKELIETYPVDGVVLVRDDNGGVCDCERCTAFTAQSRTKNAVWEQYLLIHDWLRTRGFSGEIGVYPYFDGYTPSLDAQMPDDLFIAGHGASTAALTRSYEKVGHMGDTWLDNLYTNFRLPPSPRMRRLLGDRASFWIGGAYMGTELPWEALGFFGWEPTATPNSFRYQWGARTFGDKHALAFVSVSDAYEALWEINARYMLPGAWMKLSPEERDRVTSEGLEQLAAYGEQLDALEEAVDTERHVEWFGHMRLFPVFFEYHLRRLARFTEIYALVETHGDAIDSGERLAPTVREAVLAKYAEIYTWADAYSEALNDVPGDMLFNTRHLTHPYKEWMPGWDTWLDPSLTRPQFAGELEVSPVHAEAGKPFVLRVEIRNTGVCPWIEEAGQRLELTGPVAEFSLNKTWTFTGEAMAPGDRRTIELEGLAPAASGECEVVLAFYNASRAPVKCAEAKATIIWK